jgi:hypothetical protein
MAPCSPHSIPNTPYTLKVQCGGVGDGHAGQDWSFLWTNIPLLVYASPVFSWLGTHDIRVFTSSDEEGQPGDDGAKGERTTYTKREHRTIRHLVIKLRIQISLTKELIRRAKSSRVQNRKTLNPSWGERARRRRCQKSQLAATRSAPIPIYTRMNIAIEIGFMVNLTYIILYN